LTNQSCRPAVPHIQSTKLHKLQLNTIFLSRLKLIN